MRLAKQRNHTKHIKIMSKKRSSSKPSTPLGLLRGAIGDKKTAKHLANALEEFKGRGPVEKYPVAYVQATHSTQLSSVIPAGRRVSSYGMLGSARPLEITSFPREIQWVSVICYISRLLISKFLELRINFFAKFSAGDFDAASLILDEIDAQCGKSLWVMENKISLISVSQGFEAQKKFISSETKKFSRTNFSFMSASIGERNEPRVTAEAFEQRLRHRSTSWEIQPGQMAHIFYRLCNIIEPSEEAFSAVLAHEVTYSVIDLYEALIDLVRRSKKMQFSDDITAVAAIQYLDGIQDPRKTELLSYLKDEIDVSKNTSIPDFELLFREGKYEEVIEKTTKLLDSNPWEIGAIVAYSKASTEVDHAYTGSSWLAQQLIPDLRLYFSGGEAASQSIDSIIKLANNFRHADFSVPLIILMKSRAYRWFDRIGEQASLISIFARESVPVMFDCIPTITSAQNHNWTSEHINANRMSQLIKQGDLENALVFAKSLMGSQKVYYSTLGRGLHANLLAKTLMIPEAIEESVEALVSHISPIEFTPLLEVLRDRGYRHLKSLSGSAALASAFYLYIAHTENSEKEVSLKVAWKNYLSNKGVEKPSLYKPVSGYSAVERYFLHSVCVQDSMEFGHAFSSQLDLDRERMAICVNLANDDPANAEIYNQEIVDLTRRINIEEGVALLESSRIFVDEIGIQKWAKKNLESQFLRYVDYLSAGLVVSIQELEAEIRKIINSSDNQIDQLKNYLDDYDITADSLIEGVLRELSQAFLQLPRYGLDSFLSSRVRHGSFVGYIRGPLEARKLVTKKNTGTGKYYDNDVMLDRWQIFGERERRVVNTRLAILSEGIDEILDKMVGTYLHVKSRSHPDGMVTYTAEQGMGANTVKTWVVVLKTSLTKQVSLETLVAYCVENFFWPAIRLSLEAVKNHVQNNLAEQLISEIQNFFISIDGVTTREQREIVLGDIRASISELHDALRRVSLWFDLPQANTQMLSMPLERALEIGLISTRNTRPEFNPIVNWEIEPEANIVIRGASIGLLNDFAFLVFANISKHSGFEDNGSTSQSPKVWISIKNVNGAINIHCKNEISQHKQVEDVKKGIALADAKIAERDAGSIDKQKEGTGLARLAIYFDSFDGAEDSDFKYWFDEKNLMFNVEFRLPASMVKMIGVNA